MDVLRLGINLVLAMGLLSGRWHRLAAMAVCVWSAGAALLLVTQERWGWAGFYALCGFGGLLLWLAPLRKQRASEA